VSAFYVKNENTLGYTRPDAEAFWFGILHASVLKGSTHGRLDAWTYLSPLDRLRPATLADFEEYRVVPPPAMLKVIE